MNATKKNNSLLTQLFKNNAGLAAILKPGDLVEGIITERGSKKALFDLGRFGIGTVYGVEFMNAAHIIKNLEIGAKITAKVVELDNHDGFVELSLADADRQKSWEELKDLQGQGTIIEVKINGANSGGLVTELNGIKAFIPVSHLATDHYPRVDDGDRNRILDELRKLVGTTMKVKVMDLKPRSNKLILSEREMVEKNSEEVLNKYSVGQVVDGIISGVADFGAFMRFAENPNIEGLIHISELDHKLIENPKEIVKIGDAVKAKIVDLKAGRASLSLKALKPDPWEKVDAKYKEATEVKGTVTRFNPFGAFIGLDPEIQGLIHISEFGGVEEMKKKLTLGESYTFKIESVKPAEKRIILKLKK